MKKFSILLFIAIIALTSCSKEETVADTNKVQNTSYEELKQRNAEAAEAMEQAIIDNAPEIGFDIIDPFAL